MTSELDLRNPALIGGLLFILSVPIHLLLSQDASIALAAVTLSLIGGAYIGFGARSDNLRTFAMELGVAGMFGLAALTGLLFHWSAIPIGLSLHAVWDLLHRNHILGAAVPRWYIPLCLVFDLAAALFFTIIYAT
ncbi:hypothetical protein BDE40_3539 [Litoreibacter halocynthiae]|uniref:Uncharacterized protein n=1 Tax=Litoreibacter halocynthiae TaxID=1242689 RepID=A0A4R7LB50_9RHOB|nr:DUF6010 family protein [Litoreibacter halocynthiae]TDT72687.1 hypothetical protein BDE40_3539 [Litoreibacter halocynthiae]